MKILNKQQKRKLLLGLVPPIAKFWMSWFDKTARAPGKNRLTLVNADELLRSMGEGRQVLIAFWHNRMAFGPTAYMYCRNQGKPETKGAVIMISRSFDGEVIAAVINRFKGLSAVRGGSAFKEKHKGKKGGQEALDEMIKKGEEGYDLVITPDGPQGPVYEAKLGVVELAAITGLPIITASANCERCFKATSWDQTRIPTPYSHFVYRVGPMITVPENADEETLEAKRDLVEKTLNELTEYVDTFYDKHQKPYPAVITI